MGIQIGMKEYFTMQRDRKTVRKQPRLGAMRDREVTTVTVFESLLRRFGFITRDTKLARHEGWSRFLQVQSDSVVTRVRERLKCEGKLQQRAGLFSSVHEVEAALCAMSADALLRLRARIILQDFRLTAAEDKEGEKEARA
jgi:hypothetical protein